MSTKFKVGDFVRILNCGCGQPPEWVGKIMPIHSVCPGGNITIKEPDGEFTWTFITKRLERVDANIFKPSPTQLQGKFTMEDGTPGVVDVTIRGNTTQVTIIVDPQEQYHAKDRNRQFFGGLAHCNPCDKFDINTGIKEACKNALHVKSRWEWRKEQEDYFRSIYSAIRKAMRGEPK